MPPVGVPPELRKLHESQANKLNQDDSYLALGLTSQQMGQWASDHHAEAQLLTGWNYLGIIPICKVAARANIKIFDDSSQPTARNLRKSLRLTHGPKWKSFAGDQHVGKMLKPDHPLAVLLANPNKWQSGAQYRWESIQQLHLHGGVLIWNAKNRNGKTVQRFVVPISLTTPISPGFYNDMPYGGIQVHPLTMIANITKSVVGPGTHFISGRRIPVEDLTICRYPHAFLRGDGHSPTFAANDWIQLAKYSDVARREQMKRGPMPKTMMTPMQDDMSDGNALDDFQARMDDRFLNAKGPVVAIPHGSATPISHSPEEMEYHQTFDQMGPPIMGTHGTGQIVAGMQEATTFGALAAGFKGFVDFTVQPDLDLMADEETQSIAKEYGEHICVEYEAPAFNNPEFDAEDLERKKNSGAFTVGWYREQCGEEPFGDERDDMLLGSQELAEWRSQQPDPAQQAGAASGMPMMPAVAGSGASPPGVMPGIGGPKPTPPSGMTPAGLPPGFGQSQASSGIKTSPASHLRQNTPRSKEESSDPRKRLEELTRKKAFIGAKRDGTPITIAVDLDGTLAEAGEYSRYRIGSPREGMRESMEALAAVGCGIIVFTCRDDVRLVADWLETHGFPYHAINENPWFSETSGKVFADVYWDDRAISARGEPSGGLAEIARSIGNPAVREALQREMFGDSFREQRGFLFVDLAEIWEPVAAVRQRITNPVEIEDFPHITVLYGLMGVSGDEVARVCRPMAQFRVSFGQTSVFPAEAHRKTDVVKVDVHSQELADIHETVSSLLPHVSSHPGFHPHATLAYVQPGEGEQYAGPSPLTGKTLLVKRLVYRVPGRDDVIIPLRVPESASRLANANGHHAAIVN